MHAMRAERFGGYQDLKLVEIPKPAVSDGRVVVRLTAAGVTPLDYTILSGGLDPWRQIADWRCAISVRSTVFSPSQFRPYESLVISEGRDDVCS